ncbi:MAG: hypothetical protein V7K14_20785 [Nostoc sp.]|uniref:hypothetical protein n=1 Tax=Nostoc sp. TaxID=1180 RepID=UPI002FFB50F5
MPNTSLREATPTTTLLLYERLRQRHRSVQVSTSAQFKFCQRKCDRLKVRIIISL